MKIQNLDQQSFMAQNNTEKPGTSPLQNGDKTRFYFQKLINIQHSLSSIVAVNISIMVIYSCEAFNHEIRSKLLLDVILFSLLACAVIEIIISVSRAKCKLDLQKQQRSLHHDQGLMNSTRLYCLIGETILFLLQPSPFLNEFKILLTSSIDQNKQYEFYINQILCIACLFRVYVFARSFLLRTEYMNPRSHRLCRLHGCDASYEYALKCLFKDQPSFLILLGFGASILIFGFAIQVCQRPLARTYTLPTNLGIFSNAFWLTIQTMTTVGFGQFYPYTPFGKVIVLFVVVWGIFIVPIMVVVVTNTLQMQKAQTRTLIVLNRLNISSQLKIQAAQFIAAVLKARKQTNLQKQQQLRKRVLRLKQKFKKKNMQLKSLQYNDDTYQQMSRKFQQLNQDIKTLNRNQEQLINYIHNNFEYQQEDSESSISI